MLDPVLSLAHTIQSSKGTVAFLLGSGVSRASGIPTGWEVTLELVRRVAALDGQDAGLDPANWYQGRYGSAPGYSSLLDGLARTPAERRAVLHSLFEPTEEEREQGLKSPTAAHRAVADLVAKGFAKVVVTTNFDRLMEAALQDVGVVPTVISTADAVLGAAPLVHQRCVVLKVHGDYLDDRIMNTDAELESYDPALDAYLDRVLDEFGFVVCGWSGEWDPALRRAFERCPSRRYGTYWTGMREPGPAVAKLIQLRDARFIRIGGADEFLSDLRDKVFSLEELAAAAPLSAAAAAASVKRFISEPRYRVRLDDLFADEVRRVTALHSSAEFSLDARPIDAETTRRRFLAYDASMEVLASMLFEASRWASTEHHATVGRAVASLVPPDLAGGTVRWIEMRRYPASIAFHAACAGAVAGANYQLFRRLCELKLRWKQRPLEALPGLSAVFGDYQDAANHLHGQRRYTPVSDHLLTVLRPLLARTTREPERAFDRLEILFALTVLDRMDDPRVGAFLLPGRFAWQHDDSVHGELFEEARAAGGEWPPLAAGMFRGETGRLDAVTVAFLAALEEQGRRWF